MHIRMAFTGCHIKPQCPHITIHSSVNPICHADPLLQRLKYVAGNKGRICPNALRNGGHCDPPNISGLQGGSGGIPAFALI